MVFTLLQITTNFHFLSYYTFIYLQHFYIFNIFILLYIFIENLLEKCSL